MKWEDLQKRSDLVGGHLDMNVGLEEPVVYRGQVVRIEWPRGLPVFHLGATMRFDPSIQSWVPPSAGSQIQRAQPFTAKEIEEAPKTFSGPFDHGDGTIYFAVLDGVREFRLFPRAVSPSKIPDLGQPFEEQTPSAS